MHVYLENHHLVTNLPNSTRPLSIFTESNDYLTGYHRQAFLLYYPWNHRDQSQTLSGKLLLRKNILYRGIKKSFPPSNQPHFHFGSDIRFESQLLPAPSLWNLLELFPRKIRRTDP